MYKYILKVIMLSFLIILVSACGGGSSSDTKSKTTQVNGNAQKGPFLKDSNITLCELDNKLVCTSNKLQTKV